jgi:5'-nucleotidase
LALQAAFAQQEGVEIYVAAPDQERSTCSHGMTLGRPVVVTEVAPRTFAVDGLPADCVYLVKNGLLSKPPHVVVSGINRGANLGTDVFFSGTVAGARQAVLMGMHGIAVSLTDGEDFDIAAEMTVQLVVGAALRSLVSPLLLNLNFPKGRPSGIQFAPLGSRLYPQSIVATPSVDPRRCAYQLGGPEVNDALIPGTDGWFVSQNIASATLLTCDQTDFKSMKEAFFSLEGIASL